MRIGRFRDRSNAGFKQEKKLQTLHTTLSNAPLAQTRLSHEWHPAGAHGGVHGRHYQPQPLERVGESGNRKSLLFHGSMAFAKSTRTVPTAGVDRVKRIAGFRKRPGFPSESSYTSRSRPPKIFSVLYSLPTAVALLRRCLAHLTRGFPSQLRKYRVTAGMGSRFFCDILKIFRVRL